jgi:hypothetical protein
MSNFSRIIKGGSCPFVGRVRPGNFKCREHEGRLNRGSADGKHACGDGQEFNLRFSFLFLFHKGNLFLFNNHLGSLDDPLRKDLLDSFFQPVSRFQLSSFFLFLLLSAPEQ